MTYYAIEWQWVECGGLAEEEGLFTSQEDALARANELEKERPGGPIYYVKPLELKQKAGQAVSALWDGGFDENGKNQNPIRAPYRTRLATAADEAMAQRWTDADPDHQGMKGSFWTDQQGCQSRLLYRGDLPVFFFRLEHAVRIHIQFAPEWHIDPRFLRGALESGMTWLGSVLASTGARELLFDSKARLLRRFCLGRLGFTAEPDTLKRPLVPKPPSEASTGLPR